MSDQADSLQAVTQQGHYAGAVTRLAAFALDQTIATTVFAITTAVVAWAVSLVTSGEVTWQPDPALAGLVFLVWLFVYYAYPWALSGKTMGMALVGIRVVRADGSDATGRNAALRTVALPLSFMTLGIGFLPIIFGRHRRALHDHIGGTAVVYAWDARAARLRFLARRHELSDSLPSA